MSLAVTIGLGARSRQSRILRGSAWGLVLLGCGLAAAAVWQGFADTPPAGTPAADHHAPWRAAVAMLASLAVCLALSWRQRRTGHALSWYRRRAGHALSWHRRRAGHELPRDRRRAGRRLAGETGGDFDRGWLVIDEAGAAGWRRDASVGVAPLALRDAYLGRTLISLRFAAADPPVGTATRAVPGVARSLHLLLARDAVPADQWRRLRVWALWRQRGGRDGVVL
ncbi:MAG: hypothetical protein QM766_19555 [Burkholderiaceae bacterium]